MAETQNGKSRMVTDKPKLPFVQEDVWGRRWRFDGKTRVRLKIGTDDPLEETRSEDNRKVPDDWPRQ